MARPLVAQAYQTIYVQLRVFKIRAPAQLYIFAMRLRENCHAAHCLSVQHNIAEIDFTIDDWRILGAGTCQMEAGLTLHGEAWQIKPLKICEINVGSG